MEIQSVHRQSFGRIIAPEKYVGQQLAKIKDAKGRQIARGLMSAIKNSEVVDIFVSKKGDIVLRYKHPYSNVLGKSKKVHNHLGENNFVTALLEASCVDDRAGMIAGLCRGRLYSKPNKTPILLSESTRKSGKLLLDASTFGIDKLTKTN